MRNTIASSLADINARGGIYGRKLELVVERTEKAPTREKLKAWLDRQEPFALVGSFTPGMDREMASLVEEGNLPLIGPFTFLPLDSVSLNRHVFYIFSGLREQVKALAGFARGKVDSGDVRVALLYPARKELAETVDAAEEAFRNKGFGNVQRNKFPVGGFAAETLVRNLRQQGVGLVLFLGDDGEIEAFVKEADRQNWVPRILMPGVLIGKGLQNVSPRFRQNLFLAYPTLPEDRKDWGMMELSSVLGMQSLSSTHLSAQLSAYAAVKVLVEGLRRSGRELRQEKFLASLENLTDLDTGLTPLLSYDRNRRIGALGAYIVTIDPREKSFFTSKEWVVGY
jgi:ABC-type branched-subunit amino acid transport system substrate-binding protein